MAIKLTLTNEGEYDHHDYVSVEFLFDEDSTWMTIVKRLLSQGLPALGYVGADDLDKLEEMLETH